MTNHPAFEGAAVLVSGGTGGLGAATVRRLHAEGLGVVIADVADGPGEALAAELGGRAVFAHTDVTSEDSINAALDKASGTGRAALCRCRPWWFRRSGTNRAARRKPGELRGVHQDHRPVPQRDIQRAAVGRCPESRRRSHCPAANAARWS